MKLTTVLINKNGAEVNEHKRRNVTYQAQTRLNGYIQYENRVGKINVQRGKEVTTRKRIKGRTNLHKEELRRR